VAVQTIVDQADANAERPWHVVANQLGRILFWRAAPNLGGTHT
jgi:hypothetical protein